MTDRILFKFLKLFGGLYLRFLLLFVCLFILNVVLFKVLNIPYPSLEKAIILFFLFPLVTTVMMIGFEVFEGKLKDKL